MGGFHINLLLRNCLRVDFSFFPFLFNLLLGLEFEIDLASFASHNYQFVFLNVVLSTDEHGIRNRVVAAVHVQLGLAQVKRYFMSFNKKNGTRKTHEGLLLEILEQPLKHDWLVPANSFVVEALDN